MHYDGCKKFEFNVTCHNGVRQEVEPEITNRTGKRIERLWLLLHQQISRFNHKCLIGVVDSH